MKTPAKRWMLQLLANAAPLSLLPLAIMWNANQQSVPGEQSERLSGGDSFGIPLFGLAVVVGGVLIVTNAVLHVVLRSYPGPVPLFPRFRFGARYVVTDLFVLAAITCLLRVGVAVASDQDFAFIAPVLIASYVLLGTRAVSRARWEGETEPPRIAGVPSS